MRGRSKWWQGLERPIEGRLIAGVCISLSERLALDVTLLRLAFFLLALADGIGVGLYLLLWVLLPLQGREFPPWSSLGEFLHYNLQGMSHDLRYSISLLHEMWSRPGRAQRWPRPLSRRWIALVLVFGGGLIFLYSLGLFGWLGTWRALGLATVVIGLSILISNARDWRS